MTTKTNTTKSTAIQSAAEFRRQSYDAYLAYTRLIEGKSTVAETVTALAPLAKLYGLTLTPENLVNTLTVKMTSYGKDKGETARKIKSIATFRAYIKGGWREVAAAPVHANAGKAPAAKSAAKKPTKADLEAEIAAPKAQLAAK